MPRDVNSTAGFTEALALAAGRELTDDERASLDANAADRDVASGLVEGPARDPDTGQFAPAATADPPADPPAAAVPPADPPADPPQGQGYEDGFQAALGQQAERLGEERARREALEARLAAIEAQQAAEPEPQQVPVTTADLEALEERFDEDAPQVVMSHVANNEPHLIEDALDIWYERDPRGARRYERQVNAILAQQEEENQPAPQGRDPFVANLEAERLITASAGAVMQELGEAKSQSVAPHLQAAYENASPLLKTAIDAGMTSNDPEQIKAAYREIVRLAEPLATGQATTVAGEQRQQQVVAQKRAAQVATGSQRPVTQGQTGEGDGTPQTREEYEALKRTDPARAKALATRMVADAFLKTETTSVADGLTFGKE